MRLAQVGCLLGLALLLALCGGASAQQACLAEAARS
jgi:hypothetical protein